MGRIHGPFPHFKFWVNRSPSPSPKSPPVSRRHYQSPDCLSVISDQQHAGVCAIAYTNALSPMLPLKLYPDCIPLLILKKTLVKPRLPKTNNRSVSNSLDSRPMLCHPRCDCWTRSRLESHLEQLFCTIDCLVDVDDVISAVQPLTSKLSLGGPPRLTRFFAIIFKMNQMKNSLAYVKSYVLVTWLILTRNLFS